MSKSCFSLHASPKSTTCALSAACRHQPTRYRRNDVSSVCLFFDSKLSKTRSRIPNPGYTIQYSINEVSSLIIVIVIITSSNKKRSGDLRKWKGKGEMRPWLYERTPSKSGVTVFVGHNATQRCTSSGDEHPVGDSNLLRRRETGEGRK